MNFLPRPREDWSAAPFGLGPSAVYVPAGVRCLHCLDSGHVCEDHPESRGMSKSKVTTVKRAGARGCLAVTAAHRSPRTGTHSIAEAFMPDWTRP